MRETSLRHSRILTWEIWLLSQPRLCLKLLSRQNSFFLSQKRVRNITFQTSSCYGKKSRMCTLLACIFRAPLQRKYRKDCLAARAVKGREKERREERILNYEYKSLLFWKHNNNYAKIWLAWNKLKTYKFKVFRSSTTRNSAEKSSSDTFYQLQWFINFFMNRAYFEKCWGGPSAETNWCCENTLWYIFLLSGEQRRN